MNAADVVGYTFDAETYCSADCLPDGVGPDDEGVGAIFADESYDYRPTCGGCGEPLEDVSVPSEDTSDDDEDQDDES